MSVSSINNNLPSYINLPNRAERINAIDNRIVANNREIVSLESQITAHKEVSSITREMIVNNAESINTIKELIGNNEKSIKFLQETQVLAKESKDVAEARLNNLKETQVLAKQAIDCIEKMLAIMMKNPAKYGGLDKSQFQQLPEVVEAKKNLTDVVAIKLNQYPKEEYAGLMDTAKKVIDRSFHGINTTDLSSNKKIFSNLEKNIDVALAEQYTLKKDDYMSTIRNYRIIQKLFHNFSSLSIKNFKI